MQGCKRAAKAAGQVLAAILGCIAAGYLLLVLVFALPTARMAHHGMESVPELEGLGIYPTLIFGMSNTKLDNATDEWMLDIAVYDGPEPAFEKAAMDYFRKPLSAAAEPAQSAPENAAPGQYARYWHGYLLFLKPLLLFLNLSEIRMLNMCAQLVLLAAVLVQAVRRRRAFLVLPLVLTYFMLTPLALFFTLEICEVYYIAFGALLVLMPLLDAGRERDLFLFFTVIGCLTSYFDFLTAPLLTWGLPLAVYLAWRPRPLAEQARHTLAGSACWLAGYLGMWFGKWAIATAVSGQDIIAEAAANILFRASGINTTGGTLGMFDAVQATVTVYTERPLYWLIAAAAAAYYLLRGLVQKNGLRLALRGAVPFALLGWAPMIWCLAIKNHSWQHAFFTHRIWALSWMCYFCVLLQWGCQKEIMAAAAPLHEGGSCHAV